MKIFSTEKYIEKRGKMDYERYKMCVDECEGKTEEQCKAMGYDDVGDSWMIEKESK